MAIFEIAKIQIRRGQEGITGQPTLSPGEFGWAQDTEKLWIGKSIVEGAPDNNNTRILTENDLNLFNVSITTSTYQYAGHIPLVTVAGTVTRSLQSKLDEIVTVFDFGADNAFASTSSYNLTTLQTAIDNIFLSAAYNTDEAPAGRVILKIPGGTYNLNGHLLVPPYATLMGDGKGKTILNLTTSNSALIKFSDADGSELTPSVASNKIPTNIALIGMTLQYDPSLSVETALPLLIVDSALDSYAYDVEFKGKYDVDAPIVGNGNYCGAEIKGQTYSFNTRGFIFDKCIFRNLYYGMKSNSDSEDVVIDSSLFEELNRGIVYSELATTSTAVTGPLRTKVGNSKFHNIEKEGIFVGDAYGTNVFTHHVSKGNTYKNVGGPDDNPNTPVINFKTLGNISDDYISRLPVVNSVPTVTTFGDSWAVSGKAYIDTGVVYAATISATTSTAEILTKLPFNGVEQFTKIEYNIIKPASSISRQGSILIRSSILSGAPNATIADQYSYTGASDGGLIFTAALNTSSNTVEIGYTSPDAIGTITYRYTQLQ